MSHHAEMKPASDAPRWVHRVHASLHGYFWLPCPICGEEFGGHENGPRSVPLMRSLTSGETVCAKPACQQEADRRNKANNYFQGDPR